MPERIDKDRFVAILGLMAALTLLLMVIANAGHKRQLAEKDDKIRQLQRR